MSRTLRPEDRIAHYKVVSALAAGGMGEVYLAQDQTLERSVALKILPPDLVKNEERVRRFEREAKSASSLSHPNIVTIYEIGQGELESEGDEPASDPIHFISMELVTGDTLGDEIHKEGTDLKTLLGYLAQAAEGIAKAHAAGIVHRDLKPSNIMVTRDGYAKVLDFGLAKLMERQEAGDDMTAAATVLPDATGEGVVLGTVGYMSPEQVRGKSVDHRSDIFSFGCILYEAATRKRPFTADSHVETMHKILHDTPAPVEELNPDVPRAVRRLVKRCLTRNPEQRLQSMKDLAIELQDIVDEYDSLSSSATSSASAISDSSIHAEVKGRRIPLPLLAVIVLAGIAGLAFGLTSLFRGSGGEETPGTVQATTMQSAVSDPTLGDAAISPDGRYLAYTKRLNGESGLWVRQLATGSDVEVVPPSPDELGRVTFSNDGTYIYYLRRDPDLPNYRAVFEVPLLGGQSRKRFFDVDTPITFSPDGSQVCFRRGVPDQDHDSLILADFATGKERILATGPLISFNSPSWSPDGKHIATVQNATVGEMHLLLVNAETGEMETLGGDWVFLGSCQWLPGGSALAASGFRTASPNPEMWHVSFPDGDIRRITNDGDTYFDVTSAGDEDLVAARRRSQAASLWSTASDGSDEPLRITQGSARSANVESFCVTGDGTVVASIVQNGWPQLLVVGPKGGVPRQITVGETGNFEPDWIPGTRTLLFNRFSEELGIHVWRIDLDGGELSQLTTGPNTVHDHMVLPNGDFVYETMEQSPTISRMPAQGGNSRIIHQGSGIDVSPDGTLFTFTELRDFGERLRTHIIVRSLESDEEILVFVLDQQRDLEWTPKGDGFTVIRTDDGQRRIEFLPLAGGDPVPLFQISEGRLGGHAWAPDGSHMVVRIRLGSVTNLYRVNPDGSDQRQLTDFRTGQVFDYDWSPDGSRLVFTHGTVEQDVVLIRDFR